MAAYYETITPRCIEATLSLTQKRMVCGTREQDWTGVNLQEKISKVAMRVVISYLTAWG
jgi:hypothetical protein